MSWFSKSLHKLKRTVQKNLLDYQLDEFLEWKEDHGADLSRLRDHLVLFRSCTSASRLQDVNYGSIRNFYQKLVERYHSDWQIDRAMLDLRTLFKYFNTRKARVLKPMYISSLWVYSDQIMDTVTSGPRVGRPRDTEFARMVMEEFKKGKTFRQIRAVLEKKLKRPVYLGNVYRSYQYAKSVEKPG